MTENEAIEIIKTEKTCVIRNIKHECNKDCYSCDLLKPDDDILSGYDMAIKALEETQQYRAIGTPKKISEELNRLRNDNECQGLYFTLEERQDLARQHRELEEYKVIGTVEECREAVEKQREMIAYCEENDCADCPYHNGHCKENRCMNDFIADEISKRGGTDEQ